MFTGIHVNVESFVFFFFRDWQTTPDGSSIFLTNKSMMPCHVQSQNGPMLGRYFLGT